MTFAYKDPGQAYLTATRKHTAQPPTQLDFQMVLRERLCFQ